jgi:hypothetical protein
MAGTTTILPLSRNRFFRDKDRVLSVSKHEEQIESFTIDWNDVLDTGETISTSAWDSDGPTVVTSSNTTTTATVKVSTGSGELRNKVVTSASRTLVERLRVITLASSEDYA